MARHSPPKQKLKFSLSLLQKGLSNLDLIKRLKALHLELLDLDQDAFSTPSLLPLSRESISHTLLLHKDKSVKAYLSTILVDILRLFAPTAPYTEGELKDIFEFLFRQLRCLGGEKAMEDPHWGEYFYLCESLANVKSLVLICDLEAGDQLLVDLFRTSIDLISSSTPKNIFIHLTEILQQTLHESTTLPPSLIQILLSQFLPSAKPSSRLLITNVCNDSSDKLQKYFVGYFTELFSACGEEEESESEAGGGGVEEKLGKELVGGHDLVVQVNRYCPGLLLNVIPLLEEELSSLNPAVRKLSTITLGQMSSLPPTTLSLFLKRSHDKEPKIRAEVVKVLPEIWKENVGKAGEFQTVLLKTLLDPDDKVRIQSCKVFDKLEFESIKLWVGEEVLRKGLGERCRDRKESVRKAAFGILGKLFGLAYPDLESKDFNAVEQFGWIPGCLLDCLSVNDNHIRCLVDSTFLTSILPLPLSSTEDDISTTYIDRYLTVMELLNGNIKQIEAFFSLAKLGDKRPGMWEALVGWGERNNGGIIDDDAERVKAMLKKTIQAVSSTNRFPDALKASEDLKKFTKANEKQLWKLLKTLMDFGTDLKGILKAYKETLKRVEQMSPAIVDTLTYFIRGSSPLYLNRSSISPLLKKSSTSANARLVLRHIAKTKPILFKTHLGELGKAVRESKEDEGVEVALHAVSRLMKVDESVGIDKKLSDRAKYFAKDGNVNQAKYASTIIALDSSRPGCSDNLVDELANELAEASDEDLVRYLGALNRLARFSVQAFENKSAQITESVLEVLARGTVPGEILEDDEATWVEETDMDDLTKARILSLKILASRVIAYAESEQAGKVAAPIFGLLWPFLIPRDDDSRYSPPVASRLRLTAALCLLKLATSEAFQVEINKKFGLLARTAQDPCFEVRSAFVTRLMAYLRNDKIKTAARFNMILFLVAHDPEKEIKDDVVAFVKFRRIRLSIPARQASWEHPFVRLIHLLARHPDFRAEEHEVAEIVMMSKYIMMYIDNVVTQDNIPYVYHLALKLKTVRDSESDEYDNNLYLLSELSQHLLKARAHTQGWAIPTQPESPKMPGDIFRPLGPEEANKNVKRVYLSTELLAQVKAASKVTKPHMKKRAAALVKPKAPKKEPKEPRTSKPRTSKKKATKKWGSDSEEDEEDEPSSASESDDEDEEVQKPPEKKARNPPKDRQNPSPRVALPGGGKKKMHVNEKVDSASESDKEVVEKVVVDKKKGKGKKVVAAKKDESDDESEVEEEEEPEKKKPASKKKAKVDSSEEEEVSKKSKKSPKGKGKATVVGNGKKGGKEEPPAKPLTRGVIRGLKQPRAMVLKGTGPVSDLSEDSEMEVDS